MKIEKQDEQTKQKNGKPTFTFAALLRKDFFFLSLLSNNFLPLCGKPEQKVEIDIDRREF